MNFKKINNEHANNSKYFAELSNDKEKDINLTNQNNFIKKWK